MKGSISDRFLLGLHLLEGTLRLHAVRLLLLRLHPRKLPVPLDLYGFDGGLGVVGEVLDAVVDEAVEEEGR